MAKYSIAYACGHADDVQICGPQKDRGSKVKWMQERDCPACYAQARRDKNAAETARQITEQSALSLPALIGSEKQIVWATTIRARMIADVLGGITANELLQKIATLPAEHQASASALLDIMRTEAAAWWIDHRDGNLRTEVGKKLKEEK